MVLEGLERRHGSGDMLTQQAITGAAAKKMACFSKTVDKTDKELV
jgi:hypothetical protein